jgi:predicted dehydrogenase
MSERPVRVGLVGLGGHGKTIQDATAAAADLRVTGVYDVNDEETSRAAERFGCEPADSYESLLGQEDLDAVVLVTPNRLHSSQATAAFARGLHVFVEKPIANTIADGLEIIAAADRTGRVLMVGHNMRMGPATEKARETVRSGALGRIISVEIHFSADNTHRLPAHAWRLRPEECPLMPVMQLGIHGIDLIHDLVAEITEVDARTRSVTTPPGVVDSVVASFTLAGGAIGTLVSNYCSQVRFEYRIAGTEGTLQCTPHRYWFRSNAATDGQGGGIAEEFDFADRDRESYARQMHAFAEAVRRGRSTVLTGRDGLQALAVVEAMHRSSISGSRELVPIFNEEETRR